MSTPRLVEHFFRHEYGKLVATLARRVGFANIEAVEDAVQSALMKALEHWQGRGLPDNPSAWLFVVAHNELMSVLRTRSGRRQILEARGEEYGPSGDDDDEVYLAGEIPDDLLRMLFVCCDERLPAESQLVLALKTLCGFGVDEIAARLFITEAKVYKRLSRARARLREDNAGLADLSPSHAAPRLPAVHQILYLLFTEGYLSSHATLAIRRELCSEALRLGAVLAEHPVGQTPQTCALLALMHLHAARMKGRQDASGGLILLEDQDRSLWDQSQIQLGLEWLARSASGDTFSRYHAEAGIAAEHALAPSFAETRWDKVAERYALLEQVAPSALHRLNRAVAVAEWRGPAAGLEVLEGFVPPSWLAGSYMWAAVLSDLNRRAGIVAEAERLRMLAIEAAPTAAVRAVLEKRLAPS